MVKEVPRLVDDEENTVRYIGGYVVRQVKEKLKKPKDDESLIILNNMIQSEKLTSSSSSEQWIETVDRGGLVRITDTAYQCFYAIEYALRRHFDVTKIDNLPSSQSIKDQLSEDDDVQFYWCLTGEMNDVGSSLLKLLIEKWVTIRGNSFAKSIVEQHKQVSKTSTQKSKGMHTQLFKYCTVYTILL